MSAAVHSGIPVGIINQRAVAVFSCNSGGDSVVVGVVGVVVSY